MQTGKGRVTELILRDRLLHARISCDAALVPLPGQYLLVSDGSDLVLPVPVFHTDSSPDGFIGAPAPKIWLPGTELFLRGPLGRGFTLPSSMTKVCLVAFDDTFARLRGLIRPALIRSPAIAVVSYLSVDNLPDEIELHPITSLEEVLAWADYIAFDIARENLGGFLERLGRMNQTSTWKAAEIFVRTPLLCGGIADCGVCAVPIKSGWRLACNDGPVFGLKDLLA